MDEGPGGRIHRPPPLSTPREAPWREVEEIIDGLKAVVSKLDEVITALGGMPAFPGAPTTISIDGRLDALIEKLDALLRAPAIPGIPLLDGRIDSIVKYTKNRPAWDHGQKDVVIAGTAEQLPDMPIPDGLYGVVRAKPGNTEDVYLGKSKGHASRPISRITLAAGEAHKLRVTNFSLWFIDAAVSGEGVEYFVEKD